VTVRDSFLRTGHAAAALIARPEVARAWDGPSALERFSVRGLAGHLARCACVVETYLDAPVPADATDIGDAAGYFLAAGLSPDLDLPLNAAIRDRGEEAAPAGPAALGERLAACLARLDARLSNEPAGRRVAVFGGSTLDLDAYLVTRIVELAVHTDDIAVSVGVEVPPPDPDAAAAAIDCLVTIARRSRGDVAVLRALTRRERDPHGALRVL